MVRYIKNATYDIRTYTPLLVARRRGVREFLLKIVSAYTRLQIICCISELSSLCRILYGKGGGNILSLESAVHISLT